MQLCLEAHDCALQSSSTTWSELERALSAARCPWFGVDLDPVVEFGMRLGEGTGALSALPTVLSAVDIMTSMSTFADAGVSDADAVPDTTADPEPAGTQPSSSA